MPINQGLMSALQTQPGPPQQGQRMTSAVMPQQGVTSTTKKNPYAPTNTGPTPGNSAVTSTGQVNPATPPTYSQNGPAAVAQQKTQTAAAAAPAPAQTPPTSADPFTAMGGGVWMNGGWVPKTNPAAQAFQAQQGGASGAAPATVPGLPAPTTAATPPADYLQHLPAQGYQGTNLGQHQNILYDATNVAVNAPNAYGDYQQYAPQTKLPTQGYQAGQFSQLPTDSYKAGTYAQTPTQGYQAGDFGNTPFSKYAGGQISQFQGPQNQQAQQGEQALLMQMLNNPLSMSDQNVSQLKAKQRATALAMQQSGQSQNAEAMAGRGMSGGGQQQVQDARLRDQANTNILSGNRDIDLQKMTQDQADRESVLGLANTSLNSASARNTTEYAQQLAGQQAQEKVGLDTATSAQEAERLGLTRTTAQENARLAQSKSAEEYARLGMDRTSAQELANLNEAKSAQDLGQLGLNRDIAVESSRMNQAKSAQDLASLGLQQDTLRQNENQFGFGTKQQQFKDTLAANEQQLNASKFNAGENWNATQSAIANQNSELQRRLAQAADNQTKSTSAIQLGGMQQDAWNNAQNRAQTGQLADKGFAVDNARIDQTGRIAGMDNSTRLMDMLLQDKRGMIGLGQNQQQINNQSSQFGQTLGQNQSQFGQTMGYNRDKDMNNLLQSLLNGGSI